MADKKETYTVIRDKTGQTGKTTENLLWVLNKKKKKKGDAYFMVFESILLNKKMTLTYVRVYYHLTTIMKAGGWILPTQKGIADDLGMDVQQLNRALGKLKEAGYISQEIHPDEKRKVYRVNPFYTAKGHLSMRTSQIMENDVKESRKNGKKENNDEK